VRWSVIFTDRPPRFGPLWWLVYLRPGFRHVHAARYDGGGRWQVVQVVAHRLEVSTIPEPDYPARMRESGARVLEVERDIRREYVPQLGYSCVSVTKALLGVRGARILTPYGLWSYLLPHGTGHPEGNTRAATSTSGP